MQTHCNDIIIQVSLMGLSAQASQLLLQGPGSGCQLVICQHRPMSTQLVLQFTFVRRCGLRPCSFRTRHKLPSPLCPSPQSQALRPLHIARLQPSWHVLRLLRPTQARPAHRSIAWVRRDSTALRVEATSSGISAVIHLNFVFQKVCKLHFLKSFASEELLHAVLRSHYRGTGTCDCSAASGIPHVLVCSHLITKTSRACHLTMLIWNERQHSATLALLTLCLSARCRRSDHERACVA